VKYGLEMFSVGWCSSAKLMQIMCHRLYDAGSSVNKSVSAVPYNRTIHRAVEKKSNNRFRLGQNKNKTKKMKVLYFNCGEKKGGGGLKNLQFMGKLKPSKLQSYKLTVVQLFLPGL
jgi:hypothetical protein